MRRLVSVILCSSYRLYSPSFWTRPGHSWSSEKPGVDQLRCPKLSTETTPRRAVCSASSRYFLQPVSPQFWNRQMPDRSVCSPCFLRRSDECQFVPPVRAVSPPFLTTSSNKSHVKYRPTPRRCSIWPAPPCNLLGQIHGRHQINPFRRPVRDVFTAQALLWSCSYHSPL